MKKKIRKQLLRKYAALSLLSLLSLLYLLLGDWLFGYGLLNLWYICNYLLYTASEKLTALFLLLCLLIPDVFYWITGTQPGRRSEK
ncbi:hypothetical protein [Paenibacillus tengchongensis]|uniref:hypothetical protein n=1 Tax=Paenibacillus tengchongensis TaxID=2608684 RepID=UPI00124E5FA4|nr:hypothetical protein [Paenibacillus tengchongensis]